MSRRKNKPAAEWLDVRKMSTRDKILLLGKIELARTRAVLADALKPGTSEHEARIRLARSLPYYDTPSPTGPGRPRDRALDRAARQYVAVIKTKEEMRAQGIGGLLPDKYVLDRVARQHFPDAADITKAMERVKNAAKKLRREN